MLAKDARDMEATSVLDYLGRLLYGEQNPGEENGLCESPLP